MMRTGQWACAALVELQRLGCLAHEVLPDKIACPMKNEANAETRPVTRDTRRAPHSAAAAGR